MVSKGVAGTCSAAAASLIVTTAHEVFCHTTAAAASQWALPMAREKRNSDQAVRVRAN